LHSLQLNIYQYQKNARYPETENFILFPIACPANRQFPVIPRQLTAIASFPAALKLPLLIYDAADPA
jgi:hypothetical protein